MNQLCLYHELSFKVVVELRANVQVSKEGKSPWKPFFCSPGHLDTFHQAITYHRGTCCDFCLHSMTSVTQLFHFLLIPVKINKLWLYWRSNWANSSGMTLRLSPWSLKFYEYYEIIFSNFFFPKITALSECGLSKLIMD